MSINFIERFSKWYPNLDSDDKVPRTERLINNRDVFLTALEAGNLGRGWGIWEEPPTELWHLVAERGH